MHTKNTNKLNRAWRVFPSGNPHMQDWKFDDTVNRVHPELKAPTWAKALFVARSGGNDTLVWAADRTPGNKHVRCQNASVTAFGLVNPQKRQRLPLSHISLREGNAWQLVGVRDTPAPVRKVEKSRVFAMAYGDVAVTADFSYLEHLVLAAYVHHIKHGSTLRKIKSRELHDEARANALDEALDQKLRDDMPLPLEWVVEWNELRTRLNKEQK